MIKNISISYDAYKRLEKLKCEHESFSDVIKRITRKAKLDEFYGCLNEKITDELTENINELRDKHKKNRINRLKNL